MSSLVTELQLLAADFPPLQPDAARTRWASVAQCIPESLSRIESLLARDLLVEAAWQWGDVVHGTCGIREQCRFNTGTQLGPFFRRPRQHPSAALGAWIESFIEEFARCHSEPAEMVVAAAIRADPGRRWSAVALAKRVHLEPTNLQRRFKAQYGVSLGDFQRRLRIAAALPRLRTDKVAAVAASAGYRSKKNFYSALKRTTGLTPSQFRNLSSADASKVIETLQSALGYLTPGR